MKNRSSSGRLARLRAILLQSITPEEFSASTPAGLRWRGVLLAVCGVSVAVLLVSLISLLPLTGAALLAALTAIGAVALLVAQMQAARRTHAIEETMRVVSPFTIGFMYRAAVTPPQATLTWLFGSPQRTVAMTPEECLARNGWLSAILPDDQPRFADHWAGALRSGSSTVEYRVRSADGRVLTLRDHAVLADDGRSLHGVIRDITDRVDAENDLQAYLLQQAVIAELGMRAVEFDDMRLLAEHAALCVQQVLAIEGCELFEFVAARAELRLLAASGSISCPQQQMPLAGDDLPVQEAFQRDSLVLNHIPMLPAYRARPFFVDHAVQHCALVTLKGSRPLGVLCAYRTRPLPFSSSEIYFLQSVSNILAAFAETLDIRQAQRRQEEMTIALREAVSLLVTEFDLNVLLDRILETLATLIPHHDAITLALAPEPGQPMRFVSQRGYDDIADALREATLRPDDSAKYGLLIQNQFVIINDTAAESDWAQRAETAWIASYLGAPILIDGQFQGLINLDSRRTNAFAEQDGIILKAFAEKASLAIRNARRTAELERLVAQRTRDLASEREQLQAILDGTGDGIYYAEDGVVRYANEALLRLCGYGREALIGQPAAALHPNHPTGDPPAGRVQRSEGSLTRHNGNPLPIEMTAARPPGQESRVVVIVRDISERQDLQMRQRRFIVNAAHELRTPVTNFNTRLYLLERRPDRIDDHLPVLKRISHRMTRLVEDLLDTGTLEQAHLTVRKTPVVLQAILRETIALVETEASAKPITLTLHVPAVPVLLIADDHRLQQVFTNLVVNAIHYTSASGRVDVFLRTEARTAIVDVVDTGIGIAPEHQMSIFEPFFRVETRHVGTGLGLAISQEIVRLHDGRISVTSELGQGSTFSVHLPLPE